MEKSTDLKEQFDKITSKYVESRDRKMGVKLGLFFLKAKSKLGMTSEQIAVILGLSETYVNSRIQLLRADKFLIDALEEKIISLNAVLIIMKAKSLTHRRAILKSFTKKKMKDDILRTVVMKLNAKQVRGGG